MLSLIKMVGFPNMLEVSFVSDCLKLLAMSLLYGLIICLNLLSSSPLPLYPMLISGDHDAGMCWVLAGERASRWVWLRRQAGEQVDACGACMGVHNGVGSELCSVRGAWWLGGKLD